jgi:hypothetical protein
MDFFKISENKKIRGGCGVNTPPGPVRNPARHDNNGNPRGGVRPPSGYVGWNPFQGGLRVPQPIRAFGSGFARLQR